MTTMLTPQTRPYRNPRKQPHTVCFAIFPSGPLPNETTACGKKPGASLMMDLAPSPGSPEGGKILSSMWFNQATEPQNAIPGASSSHERVKTTIMTSACAYPSVRQHGSREPFSPRNSSRALDRRRCSLRSVAHESGRMPIRLLTVGWGNQAGACTRPYGRGLDAFGTSPTQTSHCFSVDDIAVRNHCTETLAWTSSRLLRNACRRHHGDRPAAQCVPPREKVQGPGAQAPPIACTASPLTFMEQSAARPGIDSGIRGVALWTCAPSRKTAPPRLHLAERRGKRSIFTSLWPHLADTGPHLPRIGVVHRIAAKPMQRAQHQPFDFGGPGPQPGAPRSATGQFLGNRLSPTHAGRRYLPRAAGTRPSKASPTNRQRAPRVTALGLPEPRRAYPCMRSTMHLARVCPPPQAQAQDPRLFSLKCEPQHPTLRQTSAHAAWCVPVADPAQALQPRGAPTLRRSHLPPGRRGSGRACPVRRERGERKPP